MALLKQDEKKICNWFVLMPLPKQEIIFFFLAIMAIPLSKMGRKKKVVSVIWGGIKKNATSTIFLQYFHNKLQVIRYYQFKFEFNIEIAFLIQQQQPSLKICCENIIKNMCSYHFFKKKKCRIELWQQHCRIPFNFSQFQIFFYPLFRQWHCHKPIAKIFSPPILAMSLP